MNTGLNKLALLFIFIIASVFLSIFFLSEQGATISSLNLSYRVKSIKINGLPLTVEIADNQEKWKKGLSDRKFLPPMRAMLFVFPKEDYYKIWMKDMNFPIDVFWINKDGVIVDIWKRATPDSYPYSYVPRSPAKYILETQADFAEEYNVELGDRVYNLPKK